MLSRATIIWLVLLLGFTAALAWQNYEHGQPCRAWKAAHPGQEPWASQKIETGSDGSLEFAFNPCTVIE